jgi:hypothetical protein
MRVPVKDQDDLARVRIDIDHDFMNQGSDVFASQLSA